jgi:hypothetical protein
MSRNIMRSCGTTLLRFSKNDSVLALVSEGCPLPNCQRKAREKRCAGNAAGNFV